MRYQYIRENHPLVHACRLVNDKSDELLKAYRQTTTKRDMNQAWDAYDLARRVGDRLARQIGTTSECWEYGIDNDTTKRKALSSLQYLQARRLLL